MQIIPAQRRTPWGAVVSILVALLYGVSPIDLIPDVIPLIGWLDDGVVILICGGLALVSLIKKHRAISRAKPIR